MSQTTKCAIWLTQASYESVMSRDGEYFVSPRSGGRYFISRRAKNSLVNDQRCDKRFKARLTSWLVEQRRLGNDCPEIVETTLEEAQQLPDLSVHTRADRLLHFISTQNPRIGDYCQFVRLKVLLMAMAWCESVGAGEVNYLLSYLVKRDWIETQAIGAFEIEEKEDLSDLPIECVVTVDGYARLADLDKTNRESSRAFVAMWFDESMNLAWSEGLMPGISDAGYRPTRIDRTHHGNKICDEIIAEIRRSHFIVADFTHGQDGARGGVYYEAGYAQGLNIPVIFACRKDKMENIHFDTRQYAHIVWGTPEELRQALSERISARIGDGPLR